MSKFFEALERAEEGEVLGTEAPSSRPATDTSPSPPPAAPPRGVEPAAPPHLGRPVVEAPAAVTKPRVDRPNRAEDHLVSLFDSESWEAEQYRVLRHAVETLRKGVNLQIVAVTSAAVGDGKTTTAINLAGALAQSADARVLLVDVDLRRPAVARQLGSAARKGPWWARSWIRVSRSRRRSRGSPTPTSRCCLQVVPPSPHTSCSNLQGSRHCSRKCGSTTTTSSSTRRRSFPSRTAG